MFHDPEIVNLLHYPIMFNENENAYIRIMKYDQLIEHQDYII